MNTLIKIILLFIMTNAFSQNNIAEEEIMLKNDSIVLPGTLSFNKQLKQQPLVIFIHGSGNIDRNGNQNGSVSANYIKQLSEALNKNNIAFFRYDKRTATLSNLKFVKDNPDFNSFVDDANIVIKHFKNDKRFSSTTLIGHSQGSLVAMLAANNASKYISLAGAGETIDKLLVEQTTKQNPIVGALVKGHVQELKETGTIKEPNAMLVTMFNKNLNPFWLSWFAYNPSEEIKKVTVPTLIINGTKDLQVPVEQAKMLHKAKPNAQLALINNMNHPLKNIEKDEDNLASYTSPDFPLSQELISVISEFIKH